MQLQSKSQLGFTLFEMLIVVAIVVIMTGIILANLPEHQNSMSADLVAQEVAVYTRAAQNYLGKQGIAGSYTNAQFFRAYGMHFSILQDAGEQHIDESRAFFLFGNNVPWDDVDEQYAYRRDDNRRQEQYSLPSDYYFYSITAYNGAVPLAVNKIDVYFIRPNMEANFYCTGSNDVELTGCSAASYVSLCMTSRRSPGKQRQIRMYKNGQIAISGETCVPNS